MATYTITAGQRAVHEVSLAANTEDTVTFSGASLAGGYRTVELVCFPGSSGKIYATDDGTAATVAGSNCLIVFPGQAVQVQVGLRGGSTVRLISAATATYSVYEV